MTDPGIDTFVTTTIADLCDLEYLEVECSMRVAEVGASSIALTSLAGLVESKYGVEFSPTDIVELLAADYIQDIVSLAHRLIRKTALSVDRV